MSALLQTIKKHLPLLIGVALVIVNALIANGYLIMPVHTLDLVNAILAAFGLGVLHARQL